MTASALSILAPDAVAELVDLWPEYQRHYSVPRSAWLHDLEELLRAWHPTANSDSLTYTARSLAPFPLVLPGVP